jgi:hypothetical protein
MAKTATSMTTNAKPMTDLWFKEFPWLFGLNS